MVLRNLPVKESEIDLFRRAETAEEFLSRLPPDARPVVLPDGSVVIQEGGRTYSVPPSINNEVRNVVTNVDPLGQRQYITTGTSTGTGTQEVSGGIDTSGATVASGSDFLTNVGGKDATTFDYDLTEADLIEAVELRKAAYGVDTIETSSTINAQGEEQKSYLDRIGDRLYEVFVTGPSQVITDVSPVSGKTVATKVPGVAGVLDSATLLSPIPGLGSLANKMGEKFVERQRSDAERAAVGQPLYGAVQVQEKSTGRIIDLTTSPLTENVLGTALGLDAVGVGTYAEADVTGPVIFNGREYPSIQEVIREVSQGRLVSPYVMERNIPAGEDYDRSRVVGSGEERMGLFDPDSGEVDLGFGRTGAVTGVAIDSQGNLTYKTGTGGFATGMGEMITTGTGGIAYTGGRADIVQARDLSASQAQSLLNRINTGEVTSTPDTTSYLTEIGNPISSVYGDDYFDLDPPVEPVFGTAPIPDVEKEYLSSFEELYGGDVEEQTDFTTYQIEEATLPSTIQEYVSNVGDDNNNDDDGADPSSMGDTGFGGGGGFATAKGGRIGKQEGGTTVKPVSTIVQGAGFIAPQQNASDQQTIADDIPMEAEEGDFIINAPAAEFAGRQDIVKMILDAIESLREQGVDIQYGNPKIPVKSSVQLAVSRNEVYIPKVIAEEIGYDKLEKINNRGKREVERRQQESQKQANRGGFIRKAKGDVVEDKSNIMGEDEGSFLQDLGRFVIDELGDKIKGFLSPEEKQALPTPRPEDLNTQKTQGVETRPADVKKYDNFRNLIDERKVNLNLPKDRAEAYDLLNLLEIDPRVDPRKGNVPSNNSGFTVGIGFDIGRHSESDLRNFNFSKPLLEKLLPYSGRIGKQVEKNPDFMLTDEELDEVNKIVLNTKYNKFEENFPMYKNVNPVDKAVLYSVYHLGAFGVNEKDKARYGTFKDVYNNTKSIGNALQLGLLDKIKNKNSPEYVRAKNALTWLNTKRTKTKQPPPSRPKEIQENPDKKSFLSRQLSV